jgi:SAM-dependent methyltransferase
LCALVFWGANPVTLFEAEIASPYRLSGGQSARHSTPQRLRRGAVIPDYVSGPYGWAYLNRRNARLLDHDAMVTAILLGNHRRLRRAALSEVSSGQRVLQAAHVYGCLIPELARRIGPSGRLDVIDVAPLQAALCRRKLRGFAHARVRVADAAKPGAETYDVVNCFFLLHEIPDEQKRAVVEALLAQVAPGGRAVFVDYHAPARWQPLRSFYRRLFDCFEPFAESMWNHEVRQFSRNAEAFRWKKVTMFGGVFQKTVAHRRLSHVNAPDCEKTTG